MVAVVIQDFSSMLPLRDALLLPERNAQYSENTWLYKGALRGFRHGTTVYTIKYSDTKQIYRIPNSTINPPDFVNSTWLEYPDPYMTSMRNPTVGDQYNRYYFFPSDQYSGTGANPNWPAGGANTTPPRYNTLARIQAGQPSYVLGIPAPLAAPGVTPASGSDETRAYIYTYLSAYMEEGPASPPTSATGAAVGTWGITIPAPDASVAVNRDMGFVRIYRTVTDSNGNASYYLVTTLPWTGGAISYNDPYTSAQIINNLPLTTVLYVPPPVDLQGVVLMANGILAGWSNKREVWFSAAYFPHAWPPSYALTVETPIVGLCANGSSLNIMTEGSPWIATGVTPDTMTIGVIKANEPCIGRGSIVGSGEGAYYASPNGVILLNPGGTTNITQFVYEKEFHNIALPWNWAAGKYGQNYIAFIKGGVTGIAPDGDVLDGIALDHTDKNVPFTWLHAMARIVNLYVDDLSGQLFGIGANNNVNQWNPPVGTPGQTTLWNYEWQSKKFRLPFAALFKAFQVIFDIPPEVQITLGPRNTAQNQVFDPTKQYLIVIVYADGIQRVIREIQKSEEILLIPGEQKAIIWEFEFQGQVSVTFFKAATSVKELRKA